MLAKCCARRWIQLKRFFIKFKHVDAEAGKWIIAPGRLFFGPKSRTKTKIQIHTHTHIDASWKWIICNIIFFLETAPKTWHLLNKYPKKNQSKGSTSTSSSYSYKNNNNWHYLDGICVPSPAHFSQAATLEQQMEHNPNSHQAVQNVAKAKLDLQLRSLTAERQIHRYSDTYVCMYVYIQIWTDLCRLNKCKEFAFSFLV